MNVRKATITAAIIAAAAFGITGCGHSTPATPPITTSDVVYKVTGSARSVDITMQTGTGMSQQNDISVPVKNKNGEPGLHVTMPRGGFTYISAQNQGESGTVTCSIEIDTVVVSTNTSSGAYSIATCSA
jgi:hypothetical protein